MILKLLTEHNLELLNFRGGCTGSSESTHIKMSHCWKSHVTAHLCFVGITCLACVSSSSCFDPYLAISPEDVVCFLRGGGGGVPDPP